MTVPQNITLPLGDWSDLRVDGRPGPPLHAPGRDKELYATHRLLLTTDAVGGVWRYSLELARALIPHGARIHLAVLGPPPDPARTREAAAIPGLIVHCTGLPLDWTADTPAALDSAVHTLACLAGRVHADTVQLHTPALMGSATWPVPVIAAVHSCIATWWQAVESGPLTAELAWHATAVADGLAAADRIIAPSASFAAALRSCYRLRRHVDVIHNGCRPLFATVERRPSVLTAGRLWDPGKRVATLDAAAGRLPWPVHAAGPVVGPHGVRVRFHHLHLLGNLAEDALAQAYAGAAVFASAARYEPFGLAVLEAAQAGCALVLSDIPTFRELWHDAAVFVPPDHPAALTDALARLLQDPAACARQGVLAQRRAVHYDPDRMAAATFAVHQTVLARDAA